MTPSEELRHILTLVEASAELKDDTQRKVLFAAAKLTAAVRLRGNDARARRITEVLVV